MISFPFLNLTALILASGVGLSLLGLIARSPARTVREAARDRR